MTTTMKTPTTMTMIMTTALSYHYTHMRVVVTLVVIHLFSFIGHYSRCRQPFWISGNMKAQGSPELPTQLRDLNSKE